MTTEIYHAVRPYTFGQQRTMRLRFPIGEADGRKKPCNYYQSIVLYLDRSMFDGNPHWTAKTWWNSAKKYIRSEPKAQIII